MAFKLILLAACVAVARAGVIGSPAVGYAAPAVSYAAPAAYAAPAVYAHAPVAAKAVVDTDFDPNPQYSYAYDVHDSLTGDAKSQSESRQGDVVQGSYSLVEPDGSRRTVEYTADPVNGFNAVVHKDAAATVVKTVAAAPAVVTKSVAAAPVAYSAPAYASYAAPAATITKTYSAGPVAYAGPAAYAAPAAYLQH